MLSFNSFEMAWFLSINNAKQQGNVQLKFAKYTRKFKKFAYKLKGFRMCKTLPMMTMNL